MAKLYAERDIMALDDAGNYYVKHVSAMTGEKLHSKSDIAAELAHRDYEIDKLKAQVEQLNALIVKMQQRAEKFLQPDGESESNFVNFVIGVLDGPEQRFAQATPVQCLANRDAEIKAQAVVDAIDAHKNKVMTFGFDTAIRVNDLIKYANQLRQAAKAGE